MKKLLTVVFVLVLLFTLSPSFTVLASASLERQVNSGSDDCLAIWNGSEWSFHMMVVSNHPQAGFYSSEYQKMQSGMRFTNVTIPQGSTIDTAYLELYASVTDGGSAVVAEVRGEDTSNAATFTGYTNFHGRPRTASATEWSMGSWSKGTWQTSPNIRGVIQEIVNRSSWSSGNAIVIFWGSPSAVDGGRRAATSYDVSPSKSPKLRVSYTASSYESPSADDFTVLSSKVDVLSSKIDGLSSRLVVLSNLERSLSSYNTGSATLSKELDALSIQVARIEALIGVMGADSGILEHIDALDVESTARIDKLESDLVNRFVVLCVFNMLMVLMVMIVFAMLRRSKI